MGKYLKEIVLALGFREQYNAIEFCASTKAVHIVAWPTRSHSSGRVTEQFIRYVDYSSNGWRIGFTGVRSTSDQGSTKYAGEQVIHFVFFRNKKFVTFDDLDFE